MNIPSNGLYHIYNQGNNKQLIFYHKSDYEEFFRLYRKIVWPCTDLIAYCLMPNHFHFLVFATGYSIKAKMIGKVESSELSNAFRLLQSKYAQYINVKYKRSGSLFRQKAKAKSIESGDQNYPQIVFDYIHNNPVEANLVEKPGDWPYSSYNIYSGDSWNDICNLDLAREFISFECPSQKMFSEESHAPYYTQEIFLKGDFLKFL